MESRFATTARARSRHRVEMVANASCATLSFIGESKRIRFNFGFNFLEGVSDMRFQRSKVATALAYAFGAGGDADSVDRSSLRTNAATSRRSPSPARAFPSSRRNCPAGPGNHSRGNRSARAFRARRHWWSAWRRTPRPAVSRCRRPRAIPARASHRRRCAGWARTRTLVLLNGRRLAVSGFSGGAVDINSIPLSAIDRVEVLTTAHRRSTAATRSPA